MLKWLPESEDVVSRIYYLKYLKHLIESGIKENQIIEVVLDEVLFDELLDRKNFTNTLFQKILRMNNIMCY